MTINPELMTGLGAAASVFLSSAGSAYASIHGGEFALKSPYGFVGFSPIIIGGVLSIYGLIVAVLLGGKMGNSTLEETDGYRNLSVGLSVGLACLCSGVGLGKFIKTSMTSHVALGQEADAATRPLLGGASTQAVAFPKSIVRILLCLCFLEAIGLYGLIVGLILMSQDSKSSE